MFTSEKYEFTHFICKLKGFNMIVNLCNEDSIIKLKLNIHVLEVQLNMKLQWNLMIFNK